MWKPGPDLERRTAKTGSAILSIFGGVLLGVVAYVLAVVLVMAVAPRKPENIRSVVALPWETYAYLPTILAYSGLFLLDRLGRRVPYRLVLMIGYCLAIGYCTFEGIHLLRRDFIGKL